MVIGMVFEQGVIGNCMMLGTIGKNGELRYLFWPNYRLSTAYAWFFTWNIS